MILKLLGILDILIAFILIINRYTPNYIPKFPQIILIGAGLYLLVKGLIFLLGADILSSLDIVCGIVTIIFAFILLPQIIIGLVVLYLLQKGALSLIV